MVEGRNLAARDWGGTADSFVELMYNQETSRTSTVYNSERPVWGQTFTLSESSSLLARRVRLEVFDAGPALAYNNERLGFAVINLDAAVENAVQVCACGGHSCSAAAPALWQNALPPLLVPCW